MALNKVIAGEYVGSSISVWEDGSVSISSNGGIKLNKEYVTNYKIITQKQEKDLVTTFLTGLGVGIVGFMAGAVIALFLKPNQDSYEYFRNSVLEDIKYYLVKAGIITALFNLGLLSGIFAAKEDVKYVVIVKYVDGKYSLIDCDEKVFDGILKNIY